jgi:hypothetical protein
MSMLAWYGSRTQRIFFSGLRKVAIDFVSSVHILRLTETFNINVFYYYSGGSLNTETKCSNVVRRDPPEAYLLRHREFGDL